MQGKHMVMQFSSPEAEAADIAASPPSPPSDPTQVVILQPLPPTPPPSPTEEVAVEFPPGSSAPASERSGRNTVEMTASVSVHFTRYVSVETSGPWVWVGHPCSSMSPRQQRRSSIS